MSEVLFLAHRVPFPPNRGDKIRSHHLLRHIADLAPVHVACFADDPADLAEEQALAELAVSHCLVRRAKTLALAGVEALLGGAPISRTAFSSPRIAAYVAQVLRTHPISTIVVFSGQMGQYVPDDFAGRVIFDCVDVDSAKFEAYAASGAWPMRWINAREGSRLQAEEARIAARSDVTLLVSDEEAALFRDRLPVGLAARCDVQALRNGIDADLIAPGVVEPDPVLLACTGPRLIFAGQMDYPPNIAAAERAVERLLPAIRLQHPSATLHIVGRNPPGHLLARHGKDGAFVWGGVADMRCWLAGSDLALVPLEIARGVQNKVLEAMAMALPVVMTRAAATGIGGVEGLHCLSGDSDAALIDQCCDLLADWPRAQAMGEAARRYVVEGLSWPATLAPLTQMLGPPGKAGRLVA